MKKRWVQYHERKYFLQDGYLSLECETNNGTVDLVVLLPLWKVHSSDTRKKVRSFLKTVDISGLHSIVGFDQANRKSYYSDEDIDRYRQNLEYVINHNSPKERCKLYLLSIINSPMLNKNVIDMFLSNVNDDEIKRLGVDTAYSTDHVPFFYQCLRKEQLIAENLPLIHILHEWSQNVGTERTLLDVYQNPSPMFTSPDKMIDKEHFTYYSNDGYDLHKTMARKYQDLVDMYVLLGKDDFELFLQGDEEVTARFTKTAKVYRYLRGIGQLNIKDALLHSWFMPDLTVNCANFVKIYDRAVSHDDDAEYLRQNYRMYRESGCLETLYALYLLLGRNHDKVVESCDTTQSVSRSIKSRGGKVVVDKMGFEYIAFLNNFRSDDSGIPFSLLCDIHGIEYTQGEYID